MGLDMYLEARRFLWSFDDGTGNDAEAVRKIQEALPEMGSMRPQMVICEAAYWRKANAIHRWFVDNVQEGEDDCDNYHVEREQLRELADICDQVLQDPDRAGELLPTQTGFFFGGTDYDSYYLNRLAYTRDTIRALLDDEKLKGWTFYYHSSW